MLKSIKVSNSYAIPLCEEEEDWTIECQIFGEIAAEKIVVPLHLLPGHTSLFCSQWSSGQDTEKGNLSTFVMTRPQFQVFKNLLIPYFSNESIAIQMNEEYIYCFSFAKSLQLDCLLQELEKEKMRFLDFGQLFTLLQYQPSYLSFPVFDFFVQPHEMDGTKIGGVVKQAASKFEDCQRYCPQRVVEWPQELLNKVYKIIQQQEEEKYANVALFAVGLGSFGQLGVALANGQESTSSLMNISRHDFHNKKLKAVSAGWFHSIVLTEGGELYSTGSGHKHKHGHLTTSTLTSFTKLTTVTEPIEQISAGGHHSLVLTIKGTVYGFGETDQGQLGGEFLFNSEDSRPDAVEVQCPSLPTQIVLKGDQNLQFSYVCAGGYHSILIDVLGRVYSFGKNTYGQCGRLTQKNKCPPSLITQYQQKEDCIDASPLHFIQAAAGAMHTLLLTNDGQVYGCGDNQYRQLGMKSSKTTSCFLPAYITSLSQYVIQHIVCGYFHSLFLTRSGQVLSCGWSSYGQTGVSPRYHQYIRVPTLIKLDSPVHSMSCGWNHSLLLSEKGEVYAFGEGKYGKILSEHNQCKPVKLTALPHYVPIKQVAAGRGHSLFLIGKPVLRNQIYSFSLQFTDVEVVFHKLLNRI